MIVDAVVSWVVTGLTAILGLIPSVTLPGEGSSYSQVAGWAYSANQVFPVGAAFAGLLTGIVVEAVIRGWDLTVFIYHQFWGSD